MFQEPPPSNRAYISLRIIYPCYRQLCEDRHFSLSCSLLYSQCLEQDRHRAGAQQMPDCVSERHAETYTRQALWRVGIFKYRVYPLNSAGHLVSLSFKPRCQEFTSLLRHEPSVSSMTALHVLIQCWSKYRTEQGHRQCLEEPLRCLSGEAWSHEWGCFEIRAQLPWCP